MWGKIEFLNSEIIPQLAIRDELENSFSHCHHKYLTIRKFSGKNLSILFVAIIAVLFSHILMEAQSDSLTNSYEFSLIEKYQRLLDEDSAGSGNNQVQLAFFHSAYDNIYSSSLKIDSYQKVITGYTRINKVILRL